MSDEVVDTGLGGGTLFQFAWRSEDPLSGHVAPRRYGAVDVDYEGFELAEGVITDVAEHAEIEGTWILTILVGPPHARAVAQAIPQEKISVRVRS